jgi:hypothetical protein
MGFFITGKYLWYMKTYDDLNKDRKIITRLLNKESKGEIEEFDFVVNFMSHPVELTLLLGVRDRKSFDINNYKEFIEMVITSLGYPSRIFRIGNVHYQIF